MSKWTHAICASCWDKRNPAQLAQTTVKDDLIECFRIARKAHEQARKAVKQIGGVQYLTWARAERLFKDHERKFREEFPAEHAKIVRERDESEPCCFCEGQAEHGIYLRHDPATLHCKGEHE